PPATRCRRSGRNGRARRRSRTPSSPEKRGGAHIALEPSATPFLRRMLLPEPHPVRPPSRRSTARPRHSSAPIGGALRRAGGRRASIPPVKPAYGRHRFRPPPRRLRIVHREREHLKMPPALRKRL